MNALFFMRNNNRACEAMRKNLIEAMHTSSSPVRVQVADFDKDKVLVKKYGINGVPTVVVLKEGKASRVYSGILEKNEIVKIINDSPAK